MAMVELSRYVPTNHGYLRKRTRNLNLRNFITCPRLTMSGNASTAGYVFLYAVHFFFKTKMTGMLQVSFYFGYTLMFCFALSLITGPSRLFTLFEVKLTRFRSCWFLRSTIFRLQDLWHRSHRLILSNRGFTTVSFVKWIVTCDRPRPI